MPPASAWWVLRFARCWGLPCSYWSQHLLGQPPLPSQAEPSQLHAAQPPVVRLEAKRQATELTGRVAFLTPSGTPDIVAVRSPAVQARFQVPAEDMHIADNAPPPWFKIRLQHESQQNRDGVLTLGGLPLPNA